MTWRSRICFSRLALVLLVLAPPAFLLAPAAAAADVRGRITIVSSQEPSVRKNSDFSGVVLWLEPLSGAPPLEPRKAQMIQKGKRFSPHVLAVTVGTTVDFPNYDPIFHNAFWNFDGEIFDVGLYPPGTSRSITFKREGVVR